LNTFLSNGVISMVVYMIPEDVVPPKTKLGITSSSCSVFLTFGMGKYSVRRLMELQQLDTNGNVSCVQEAPVTGLSAELLTSL